MQSFETLTHAGQLRRLRRLATAALAAYDLHEPRLTALMHGDNTTFRVDLANGERYVLRIHRSAGKTPELVHSELSWLAALEQEAELVVPSPVPTRAGELLTIARVEGVPEPRICVLFRWISGRFVDDGLTPTHLQRVGAFMARLQLSGARFNLPDGFVRGRLDNLYGKPRGISLAHARQQADNPEDEATAIQLVTEVCSPEDGRAVEQLIRRIRAVQRSLGHGPEAFGLIHGDLHQENYLFDRGQVHAIDFDDCGYGHYVYDIAVTLFNVRGQDRTLLLREGFLAGYRSIRPLSTEHEQYIDTFFDLRDLQMMIWSIEMRNHPAFRDRWVAEVQETMKYIKEVVER
ncbi:MAG: phosphotransferase [Chloroflexota bacterium]|nr:phosphotransferase [Chloroflexota bacterium]